MTDPKGSDLVVTNLRTEEVVLKHLWLTLQSNDDLQTIFYLKVVNEAHVESMMRRAGKTRAQVKI